LSVGEQVMNAFPGACITLGVVSNSERPHSTAS
jgi:hypothetical protein